MKDYPSIFMKIAELFATQSTCKKIKVGCVIVLDERIISTGYNGSPKKMKHCEDIFTDENIQRMGINEFYRQHHSFQRENELHAEMNAIAFAAKKGEKLEGSEIYVTISPCFDCAKLIIASGIEKVYYKNLYEAEDSRKLLIKNNVKVRQIK